RGIRSRTRRTCTPRPAPPTSSCSPRMAAGSPATGAHRACSAPPRARPPWGSPMTSASSASSTSARPCRSSVPPSACPPTRSSSSSSEPGARTEPMISRSHALEAVQEQPFDVVVVGGGITGAGVALDAASRGYSVALLERDDFGKGTSSRSSKMVHGGLRYLQNFDLGPVPEALLERQLLVHL